MSEQQEPMWKRTASSTKPRVYQVTPGSPIWWTDVRDHDGTYYTKITDSRAEALEQARKYAAMVSK